MNFESISKSNENFYEFTNCNSTISCQYDVIRLLSSLNLILLQLNENLTYWFWSLLIMVILLLLTTIASIRCTRRFDYQPLVRTIRCCSHPVDD
jgi:hypothetical protein